MLGDIEENGVLKSRFTRYLFPCSQAFRLEKLELNEDSTGGVGKMNIVKTKAGIRLIGPYNLTELEEKTNKALAEMTDVFVIGNQVFKEGNAYFVIIQYKENFRE
jgi:hypothetical protein